MKLDELEKLAKAANQWSSCEKNEYGICLSSHKTEGPWWIPYNEEIEFIAAANPSTILALIDRVRKLEKVAECARNIGCGAGDCCMGYGFIDTETALADLGDE